MTEAEILDAFQTSYSMQITLLTQIVGLHLAMIVGIYYFLARARLPLKIFAFLVYTTSYVTFVVMAMSQSLIGFWLGAAAPHYLEGGEANALASFLDRLGTSWLSLTVSIAANLMFLALWLGTAYFLFLYRQPPADSPVLAHAGFTPKPAAETETKPERADPEPAASGPEPEPEPEPAASADDAEEAGPEREPAPVATA